MSVLRAASLTLLAALAGACALEHPPLAEDAAPPLDSALPDVPRMDRPDAPDVPADLGACGGEGQPCCADDPGCRGALVCAAGRCAAACPAGRTACAGACRDLATDAAHCGACGASCPSGPHATATCAGGRCGVACEPGRADCDGAADTGCESDTRGDPAHCGGCGNACVTPNGTSGCADGACAVAACDPAWADCDGNPANGCEVNTGGSNRHCGGCGRPCGAGTVCSGGACGSICGAGTTFCAGMCVNTATDPSYCGSCRGVCPPRANAAPACVGGACGVRCAAGWGDCDANAMNGCETDLRGPAHCGRCRNACPARPNATPTCAGGACGIACAMGYGNCDGNATNGCETDLRAAVAHCGRCGNACPARPNATPVCGNGLCGFDCVAGLGNCDGNPANGCETDLRAVAHCGRCGNACPARPNAAPTCAMGACGLACAMGYGDCDGNPANGCEADLRVAVPNCGRCGNACPARANATPTCATGACGLACAMGYANCDAMPGTGCETDVRTAVAHCGRCGNACPPRPNATPTCAMGACGVACAMGYANCDGDAADGCEVDLRASDPDNCGACGVRCAATAVCAFGRCAPCGGPGQPCCVGERACVGGYACLALRPTGAPEALELCLRGATMGDGGAPRPGAPGEPCALAAPQCSGGAICVSGTDREGMPASYCVACGADGQPCCASRTCSTGLMCRTLLSGVGQCRP